MSPQEPQVQTCWCMVPVLYPAPHLQRPRSARRRLPACLAHPHFALGLISFCKSFTICTLYTNSDECIRKTTTKTHKKKKNPPKSHVQDSNSITWKIELQASQRYSEILSQNNNKTQIYAKKRERRFSANATCHFLVPMTERGNRERHCSCPAQDRFPAQTSPDVGQVLY